MLAASVFAVLTMSSLSAGQFDPRCPPFEHLKRCLCESVCIGGHEASPGCAQPCPSGCGCISGYIRDSKTNRCIRRDQCKPPGPPSCPPFEEHKACLCEGFCDGGFEATPGCTLDGCPSGCGCISGYIRDSKTKRCMRRDQCKPPGPPESG